MINRATKITVNYCPDEDGEMVVYKTNNRQYTFGDYSWTSDYTDSIKMAKEALKGAK